MPSAWSQPGSTETGKKAPPARLMPKIASPDSSWPRLITMTAAAVAIPTADIATAVTSRMATRPAQLAFDRSRPNRSPPSSR